MQSQSCMLCFKFCDIFESIEEDARESLAQLLPHFDNKTRNAPLKACTECSTRLRRYLRFKFGFLETQACTQTFARGQNDSVLDLTQVYLQNKGIGREVSTKDLVVCRFCLKQVTGACVALVEDQQELSLVTIMMRQCFPEEELGTISGHTVCDPCHEALEGSYDFIRSLNVENRIKEDDVIEEMEFEDGPDLKPMLFKSVGFPNGKDCMNLLAIKEEEASFSSNGNDFGEEVEAREKRGFEQVDERELNDKCKREIEANRRRLAVHVARDVFLHENEKRHQEEGDGTKEVVVITKEDIVGEEDSLSSFEDDTCESVSSIATTTKSHTTYRSKNSLNRVKRKRHKSPAEVSMYKCNLCLYETKRKSDFKRHMVIHKKPSECTMYKCNLCLYKSKHKREVKRHMVIHKKPSEVTMYKCEICSFETKYTSNYNRHMLIHKKSSECTMYMCNFCRYKTKRKGDLKRHMLVHKRLPEVLMYKCEACSFETKFNSNYKKHIRIHRKEDPLSAPCTSVRHVYMKRGRRHTTTDTY